MYRNTASTLIKPTVQDQVYMVFFTDTLKFESSVAIMKRQTHHENRWVCANPPEIIVWHFFSVRSESTRLTQEGWGLVL